MRDIISASLFHTQTQSCVFNRPSLRTAGAVKLSLVALSSLLLAQADIVDIILNALALQFVQDVDNMLGKPVRAAATVRNEMKNWFGDMMGADDPPGESRFNRHPFVNQFLQQEFDRHSAQIMGLDVFLELPKPCLQHSSQLAFFIAADEGIRSLAISCRHLLCLRPPLMPLASRPLVCFQPRVPIPTRPTAHGIWLSVVCPML